MPVAVIPLYTFPQGLAQPTLTEFDVVLARLIPSGEVQTFNHYFKIQPSQIKWSPPENASEVFMAGFPASHEFGSEFLNKHSKEQKIKVYDSKPFQLNFSTGMIVNHFDYPDLGNYMSTNASFVIPEMAVMFDDKEACLETNVGNSGSPVFSGDNEPILKGIFYTFSNDSRTDQNSAVMVGVVSIARIWNHFFSFDTENIESLTTENLNSYLLNSKYLELGDLKDYELQGMMEYSRNNFNLRQYLKPSGIISIKYFAEDKKLELPVGPQNDS